MEAQERVEQARKRVEDLKGLYVHLAIYAIVNLAIFGVNAITSFGTWWFYWPLFGWGIGVAIHVVSVIIEGPFGSRWEERKVQELLARDARDQAA